MPEIKNQFTGGKMNKDLDERLVPNGEYRDAMNIQVSTSEGSDVGTAQNILGNTRVSVVNPIPNGISYTPFTTPDTAMVVGSISDEKNDTVYYLVTSREMDYILSWKNGDPSPVFVFIDMDKDVLKFSGSRNKKITGINVIDDMLFWTDNINEPRKINIQRCKDGTKTLSQTQLVNSSTDTFWTNPVGPSAVKLEEKHITVIKKGPQFAPDMKLHTSRDADKIYTAVIEISGNSEFLNNSFSNNGSVSSSWNDFSSASTTGDSSIFSVDIVNGLNIANEEIILNGLNPILDLTGWPFSSSQPDVSNLEGVKVVLQAYDDDGTPPGLPLTDFVIKGEIIEGLGFTDNSITIKITTVDGFPEMSEPDGNRKYVIDLYDTEEKLFEFKFPRFSYRYKYDDGEYSTFAPFTQVAFVPGSFDYHPRKGYNIGMTNKLTKVELSNMITRATPKDVVAIDVLFKDDSSPNIYVVDTIRPDDYIDQLAPGLNLWRDMVIYSESLFGEPKSFVIEKETINSVVPSNQLLRPWDNVPKKALAQDVSGNRIIYANYFQNYNLQSAGGYKITPSFNITTTSDLLDAQNTLYPNTSVSASAYKSIKSLREYQLGVVFLDKYGRETPVISNSSGTTKLGKIEGAEVNRFGVSFSSDDYPESLTHFKFFIKETSTEYYNMAMDRYYSAGDGNIWLAFPSSDRNKIDIDTFLILKKGSDQDTLVEDAARYKILAIENEAPDFIKTTKRKTFSKRHTGTNASTTIFGGFSLPFIGVEEFELKYSAFNGTSGQDLADTEDELYIEFSQQGSDQVSDRYKINSITNSWKPESGGAYSDLDVFSVKLDVPLGDDVNFISDDSTGLSPTLINSGTIVNVYKYKVENLERFDGRFFVKIYFDEVFRNNIETTSIGGGTRVSSFQKVYSMKDNFYDTHVNDLNGYLTRGRYRPDNKDALGSNLGVINSWKNFASRFEGLYPDPAYLEDYNIGPSNYGYYYWREFSANASYFRRYREKKYTDGTLFGTDYGYTQQEYGNSVAAFPGWVYADVLNITSNVRALVHLSKGNSGGVNYDGSNHVEYDDNTFWKDATGWEKEFGYHQSPTQMHQRLLGVVTSSNKGVTSMWKRFTVYDQPDPYYQEDKVTYLEENPGGYGSDEASVRDTEVWFIDSGPRVGTAPSNSSLGWNGKNTYNPNIGAGVEQSPGNDWKMRLGFGGIKSENWDGINQIESFWSVGDWNSPPGGPNTAYTDTKTVRFANKLNTGFSFRWKEDPSGQIYRIDGNVIEKNKIRHSDGPKLFYSTDTNIDVPFQGSDGYNYQFSSPQPVQDPLAESIDGYSYLPIGPLNYEKAQKDLRSMAEGLSFNMSKNWKISGISPALGWDPTTDGTISGGLSMKLIITGSDGSLTSSSPTVAGKQCSGSQAEDLEVFVSAITVADPATGLPITLHVGMCMTRFDTAPAGIGFESSSSVYIVRKIKQTAGSCFKISLGGYKSPLLQKDHNNVFGVDYFNGGIVNTIGPPLKEGEMLFKQVGMNGYSPNSEFNINTISRFNDGGTPAGNKLGAIAAVGYTMEFIEEIQPTEVLSENPAIWETEPKESADLEIYYEASGSIPSEITEDTVASALPIGTKFSVDGTICTVVGYKDNQVRVIINGGSLTTFLLGASSPLSYNNVNFFRPDDLVITNSITQVEAVSPLTYLLSLHSNLINKSFILPWHNCYTFKNGVESNRIRDNFNLPFISNGVKASTTLQQEYKEEHRKYGLIYSGIYNSTSGINNLNQFIAGEKITKDVNPSYGSIQKLFSRNSDLVALCEDKVLRIQANKDALFNADGNPQLIATDRVLGQTIPFSGEYGISKNPESFASESYRAYFTDKTRGAVIRMSMDGLTSISDAGMKDYFKDNLKNASQLIGSYDDKKEEYNINIKTPPPTYGVKILSTAAPDTPGF